VINITPQSDDIGLTSDIKAFAVLAIDQAIVDGEQS